MLIPLQHYVLLSNLKFLTAVKKYLGTSLDDALYKVLQRHTVELSKEHSILADVMEKLKQQDIPQKSAEDVYKSRWNKQANNKRKDTLSLHLIWLNYKNLIKKDLDENAIDKGVANKSKKRNPNDGDIDEGPPVRPGKGDDMGNTDEPLIVNVDQKDWFMKPERPPTPDLEWNKFKKIDNKPTQKWLSDLANAEPSSKTFNDLMSTLRDFSAFVMNCIQISDLIQDILVGPL
nr:hypothetical protein [Tanacetum cinerariifolium]